MYLFLKPLSIDFCRVSFEGKNWYIFRKRNIEPYSWLEKLLYIVDFTDNEMIYADGTYDKQTKVLRLKYDEQLYKLYASVVRMQSLTQKGQTFLVSDKTIKEGQLLPLEVKLVAYKEPIVGELYKVESAEEASRQFKDPETQKVRTVDCVVVDYEPLVRVDTTRYRATLWVPDSKEVAPSGKLGSHIAAFADYFGETPETLKRTLEPEEWVGKVVKILKWSERVRMIAVMPDESS